jgi:carbon monoxide dehydrogenase subunit G
MAVRMEKEFQVERSPEEAIAVVNEDATLVGLFPDTETEIVEKRGDRKTTRSRYRALGREGVATFHFDFEADGDVSFEKVCDGRVWRELTGRMRFAPSGKGTRVRIEMDGRTKPLVPEFTIKGPMQDQIQQMAEALKRRIEAARS